MEVDGGAGVEVTDAGDGSAGSGVGGGVEYILRSGGSVGSGEDRLKLPRPLIDEPPESI